MSGAVPPAPHDGHERRGGGAARLSADERARLDAEGYLVLHRAAQPGECGALQAAFERGVRPSNQWPVGRGHDWRHAQVDLDPLVQRVCRLPKLLDGIGHLLKQPFFLAQVEGREPRRGNAPQPLHRDGAGMTGQVAAALVWLDAHDAANGATRIIPGSHRTGSRDEGAAITLSGEAGDVLLFDPEVFHGATVNLSGRPRRSLLVSYVAASLQQDHRATEALRGVRMDTSEVFELSAATSTATPASVQRPRPRR